MNSDMRVTTWLATRKADELDTICDAFDALGRFSAAMQLLCSRRSPSHGWHVEDACDYLRRSNQP